MAPRKPKVGPKTFEKLGSFYLGREYDSENDAVGPGLVMYDAKDLTTHAVCVGMTGSGKTGLCISLLEEAAIDGIPAIAIDPKGDLGNLLLTFPKLRPQDFRPWVDEAEAARKGMDPDQYASTIAKRWREGLAEWGQGKERLAHLREAADFAIYTPGSTAGTPLTVLRSFAAPPPVVLEDGDAFRERVSATVSGLLALLGVDADPIQSREHILLSTLLQRAWQEGRDLDIATLIGEIQSPPVDRIGVMDVESFFPSRDRSNLAMRMNSLLASPGFAAWTEGEPLDIPRLLWTPEGRPRIAILSIAHLSEPERMFFVTILLNEIIAWMRTQPGTPSLRALLYMDEVFGFFPPTANPPSKTPMLTLLKQARAYGVGVVLATQNPVDLDYKGLSNAGTWFLGRLQTERDKARVIEGLEGASSSSGAQFDRQQTERILAGLKSRVFLMNNVHDDAPVLFHTRWALSYLRGPLTRAQIRTLSADRPAPAPTASSAPKLARQAAPPERAAVGRPVVPPQVEQLFMASLEEPSESGRVRYRPALLGTAQLHHVNARAGIDQWSSVTLVAPLKKGGKAGVWDDADLVEEPTVSAEPLEGAEFGPLTARALNAKSYDAWAKSLKTFLYREQALTLWRCQELKLASKPGESEAEFRIRLREAAREKRDLGVEKLRKRYAPKLARLQERIRKAKERIGKEQAQYGQQKLQTAISMGATVLGALLGRKAASIGTVGRATTAMRGASRSAREKEDVARATRDLASLQEQYSELEEEFADETAALAEAGDIDSLEVTQKPIRPRKTDTEVRRVALLWLPWLVDADGIATAAFE